MNEAAMTAEHPALQIDDFASIIGLRTQFAHDRGIIAARHETDVLAVGLCRDAKTETIRERSEEHTSELQSLMRSSYAVFCLKKNIKNDIKRTHQQERYL